MTDDTLEQWVDDFSARVLRPHRPRLAYALSALTGAGAALCEELLRGGDGDLLRAALSRHYAATGLSYAGHTNPSEAWEAIAPEGWAGELHRGFFDDQAGWLVERVQRNPGTLKGVLSLAGDPQGMLTAEALAAEHIQRMEALLTREKLRGCGFSRGPSWPEEISTLWGHSGPYLVRSKWLDRIESREDSPLGETLTRHPVGSSVTHERAKYAMDRVLRALPSRMGAAGAQAALLARWCVLYTHMGADNPFSPLVDLWKTGYVLKDYGSGVSALLAPSV